MKYSLQSVMIVVVTLLLFAGFHQNIFAAGGTISDEVSCNAIGGSWDSGTKTCTLQKDLTINSGETITIPNSVILLILQSPINIPVTVVNNNGAAIDNHGSIVIRCATLNNAGTINSDGLVRIEVCPPSFGNLNNNATGVVNNSGRIINEVFDTLNNDGKINNNSGGIIINRFSGLINNHVSGLIQNNVGATINNTINAIITNLGTIVNCGTINNEGVPIAPNSPENCPTGQPVGGEIVGIETISLFVAGVFANAGWMITLGGLAAGGLVSVIARRLLNGRFDRNQQR